MSGTPLTREQISDNRLVAPAVSVIVAALARRPAWQHDQPLKVPQDVYRNAEDEMTKILAKRGFKLARSKTVGGENFLVYGTVIIASSGSGE